MEIIEEIRRKTTALFEAAKDKYFEDGLESAFSNNLVALVEKHGEAAVKAITHLIASEIVNVEVASEALRWLGRMDHAPTYHTRLSLLERSLFSPSAPVRDGAALGLAAMDDPHAITYLKQAIQEEKYPTLREDLKQVLTQLEAVE
jgi:HEAT repeat protein